MKATISFVTIGHVVGVIHPIDVEQSPVVKGTLRQELPERATVDVLGTVPYLTVIVLFARTPMKGARGSSRGTIHFAAAVAAVL